MNGAALGCMCRLLLWRLLFCITGSRHGPGSCSSPASAAPWRVGSSWTWDQTCIPCIGQTDPYPLHHQRSPRTCLPSQPVTCPRDHRGCAALSRSPVALALGPPLTGPCLRHQHPQHHQDQCGQTQADESPPCNRGVEGLGTAGQAGHIQPSRETEVWTPTLAPGTVHVPCVDPTIQGKDPSTCGVWGLPWWVRVTGAPGS